MLPYGPLGEILDAMSGSLVMRVGNHRRSVIRWQRSGQLSVNAADRIAVILGMHPSEIWPEWFDMEEERHAHHDHRPTAAPSEVRAPRLADR